MRRTNRRKHFREPSSFNRRTRSAASWQPAGDEENTYRAELQVAIKKPLLTAQEFQVTFGAITSLRTWPMGSGAIYQKRVMLVADTGNQWREARRRLLRDGIQVTVVRDQSRALQAFETATYDTVMLWMPAGQTRDVLTHALRKRRPATRVEYRASRGPYPTGRPVLARRVPVGDDRSGDRSVAIDRTVLGRVKRTDAEPDDIRSLEFWRA